MKTSVLEFYICSSETIKSLLMDGSLEIDVPGGSMYAITAI